MASVDCCAAAEHLIPPRRPGVACHHRAGACHRLCSALYCVMTQNADHLKRTELISDRDVGFQEVCNINIETAASHSALQSLTFRLGLASPYSCSARLWCWPPSRCVLC